MRQGYIVDAVLLVVMIACLAVLGFYVYRLFYHPVLCVRRPSDMERKKVRDRRELRKLKQEFLAAQELSEASSGDIGSDVPAP